MKLGWMHKHKRTETTQMISQNIYRLHTNSTKDLIDKTKVNMTKLFEILEDKDEKM